MWGRGRGRGLREEGKHSTLNAERYLHLSVEDVVQDTGILVQGSGDKLLTPPLVHRQETTGVPGPASTDVQALQQDSLRVR